MLSRLVQCLARYFVFGLVVANIISCSQSNNVPFDSNLWQRQNVEAPRTNLRFAMVDDIVQNGRLLGMRRQDVFEMLGPPVSQTPNAVNLNSDNLLFPVGQLESGEVVLLGVVFKNDQVMTTQIHTW